MRIPLIDEYILFDNLPVQLTHALTPVHQINVQTASCRLIRLSLLSNSYATHFYKVEQQQKEHSSVFIFRWTCSFVGILHEARWMWILSHAHLQRVYGVKAFDSPLLHVIDTSNRHLGIVLHLYYYYSKFRME